MTIDPSDYGLINIRTIGAGPGRGHKGVSGEGFKIIERLNIRDALQDPRFSELAEQIRERFILIVRSYIRAGVIQLNELTP